MKHINYPSITQFQQLVELKDYREPTKKEYVRYIRKLAEHFQCDPATLTQDQVRQYFLFLREHKHFSRSPMSMPRRRFTRCCCAKAPGRCATWRATTRTWAHRSG